jgi:glycosyltransferase involved in cell wall biosynthesis
MKPLRVCIDARLSGDAHGGVEQIVIGLAAGLSKLDGDEEYLFLTLEGDDDWLRPYLDGNCRALHPGGPAPPLHGLVARASWQLEARLPAFRRRRRPPAAKGHEGDIAAGHIHLSDGTVEAAGVDVMHFPLTFGFLTRLPTIYQPHDLQHIHLPHFFTGEQLVRRDKIYRTYCEEAALVVMMTSWGKRDLVEHYGLDPAKVAVIPGNSVISSYPSPTRADVAQTRERLSLPQGFLLYPAQTWPHKNHLKLLDAIALLRDRNGLEVPVVCPGRQLGIYETVAARVRELDLGRLAIFPGFVSPLELRCLYKSARGLIFPSLFEGWGLPITEAFETGLPVASSSATGNPDVVGDAGLIFDPSDVEQIADAMRRLATDAALREQLAAAGHRRAEQFSVDQAARLFRAHYRQVGGRRLSDADSGLLAAAPLA